MFCLSATAPHAVPAMALRALEAPKLWVLRATQEKGGELLFGPGLEARKAGLGKRVQAGDRAWETP